MAKQKRNYRTSLTTIQISVDKLGDRCIKDIDCPIVLCLKMASFSQIGN